MNFKVILALIVVIALGIWGYEKYSYHKVLEEVRTEMKQTTLDDDLQAMLNARDEVVKLDLVNQYPKIHFYLMFKEKLPEELEKKAESYFAKGLGNLGCRYFSVLDRYATNEELSQDKKVKMRLRAMIQVIREDNVEITFEVKNYIGDKLYQSTQKVSECKSVKDLELRLS